MLLLIDGNALLHRYFHALPQTMRTSNGELVNAIFGFLNATLSLMDQFKPTHIVCTFDSPEKTFRHQSYEAYKATRMVPPPGLYEQLPRLLSVLQALGITSIAIPGYESDDLIGTFSKQAESHGIASLIVSSDNDFIQLVSPLTNFYCTAKGLKKAERFTPEKVKEKHGLTPEQWLDYKALRGDPSDNLPGVPGIGEKTAKQLLIHWHSLENIYLHLDELPPAQREKLNQFSKQALFTKELATINRDVPVALSFGDLLYNGAHNKAMHQLCIELEFHRLSKRFDVPDALF
ncbi:MAG: hypothetical protein HY817_03635 [Candidatus Abawacabacteria bacterium]|nr:hypothetical protein [Candidatus Abawacabacteria bacterium]